MFEGALKTPLKFDFFFKLIFIHVENMLNALQTL